MFGCKGGGQNVRSWFTLVSGLVECLGFAGAVFGWASLVFVLKTEGYFSDLCVNATINGTIIEDCRGQDEQLSLIFTISSFMNNFLLLPNGFLFDHFGTMVSRLLGISVYTTGMLLIAFSSPANSILLFPALSFIAVGGVLFFVTNIQVGNLFGKHRSTIITMYNGAFDSSSAVFLIIKTEEEMPFKENSAKGQNTDKMEQSFKSCLLSWFFMWHMLWLSVMQLRHYLFIGTLNHMLNHLAGGDPGLVSRYTNAFAFTQLCGILCAPWNGLIMDRHKGKERKPGQSDHEADLNAAVLSLSLTALQCLLFSVCAATPILPLQYLTFILEVLNRSFLYGGNAAFISVAFPPVHFGKLFGMVMALSAVVSLLQYPCFTLIKGPLGGDALYVNIGLTVLSLLAFINPLYVYLHCQRQAAQRANNNSSASS
ncbi:equilibrative nucleobase transporter 1-like isoform X2 [Xyrauchen texanus]|uniref:equilibrative nucleobase transporter 1-like isoform X2 n=1 Tax=Xyrauchen texanus TaxID=154827 RepID=UPI0022428FB9|nr:equilibrative nucleobase transporter 1-like isoform X2 [Xyrauchen texanus]